MFIIAYYFYFAVNFCIMETLINTYIRSLGRYSSEEESDTDIKNVKKKDNRRATMAAPLMQPPTSTVKPKKSSRFNESVEPEVSGSIL